MYTVCMYSVSCTLYACTLYACTHTHIYSGIITQNSIIPLFPNKNYDLFYFVLSSRVFSNVWCKADFLCILFSHCSSQTTQINLPQTGTNYGKITQKCRAHRDHHKQAQHHPRVSDRTVPTFPTIPNHPAGDNGEGSDFQTYLLSLMLSSIFTLVHSTNVN